jgi:hypothetical protein
VDVIKEEPEPGIELCPTSFQSASQMFDISQDKDPLLLNSPLTKCEKKVSYTCYFDASLWHNSCTLVQIHKNIYMSN